MQPIGNIWERIYNDAKLGHKKEFVKRVVRSVYYEICMAPEVSWVNLRDEVELDFSNAEDATGLWLPSDVIGIDSVWDITNDIEYLGRDEDKVKEPRDSNYMWYFSEIARDNGWYGTDCTISHGGTSFSISSGITEDVTGSYVSFGVEPGVYKIESVNGASPYTTFNLDQTYYGPSLDGDATPESSYSIRPMGTKKITLLDSGGSFDSDASVSVFCTRLPPPLYLANQITMLPNDNVIYERAMSELAPSSTIKREHFNSYQFELGDMMKRNPTYDGPSYPRDINNNPFSIGDLNIFSKR